VDTTHDLPVPFETGVLRRSSQSCRLNAFRRVSLSLSLPLIFRLLFSFFRPLIFPVPPATGHYWRPDTHHSVIQKPTGLVTARNVFSSRTSLLHRGSGNVICDSDRSHSPSLFTGSNFSFTRLLLPGVPLGGTHSPFVSDKVTQGNCSNVVIEVDPAVIENNISCAIIGVSIL